jgi:hypothetical protein
MGTDIDGLRIEFGRDVASCACRSCLQNSAPATSIALTTKRRLAQVLRALTIHGERIERNVLTNSLRRSGDE